MNRVLDASALLAYLRKETGYATIKDVFTEAAETGYPLLMSTVNWGEVVYVLIKAVGLEEAEHALQVIDTFPLELIPVSQELAMQAAIYKAIKKLPYSDSFAAALARLRKAELLTADKDFKAVDKEIKISWL